MLARLAAFVLLLGATTAQAGPAEVAAVVDRAHAAGGFDGVVGVTRGGATVLVRPAGQADRARGVANSAATVFRLASLTKQVTAVLIAREVSAGRLSLDAPIGRHIGGLSPTTARVTVRQLLLHRSGLPNPSDGPDGVVPEFYRVVGSPAGDHLAAAQGVCSGAPKTRPDRAFEYNNCDYLLLGAVLERLTNRRFDVLVREATAGPLGLGWRIAPADPAEVPPVAVGHDASGAPDRPQNPAAYGAAGALLGSVEDVLRWDRALLDDSVIDPAATERTFAAVPDLQGQTLGGSWSYTLQLPGRSVPLRVIERQGEIGGTRLLNLIFPDDDAAIVLIASGGTAGFFSTYSREGLGYEAIAALFETP